MRLSTLLSPALILPALALCGGEPAAPPSSAEGIRRAARALSDGDFEERETAFQALLAAGLDAPDAVLAALPDPPPDAEAAALCDRLRAEIPRARLRRDAVRAFEGTPVLQGLVGELLDRPGPEILRSLAGAVRERRERLAPLALRFLNDRNPDMQIAALNVLSGTGVPEAALEAAKLLPSRHDEVRQAALQTIHALRNRAAAAAVLPLLDDPAMHVQVTAIRTLGEIGGPAEAEAILERLGHPMEIVRQCAAQALAKIKDPAATRAVLALLESDSAERREAAIVALYNMGERSALDAIAGRLGDASGAVRLQAIYAFCYLNDRSQVARIRTLLADPEPKVRAMAARTLCGVFRERAMAADVAKLLRDGDPDVRRDALSSLHQALGKGSAPLLADALEDPDEAIARPVAETVRALAGQRWPQASVVADARAWWRRHRESCRDPRCPYGCRPSSK